MSNKKPMSPLLAVFITIFIDLLGIGIIIPVFAPLIIQNAQGMVPASFTTTDRNLLYGILTATYPFFQFFGAPILGSLADRFGRKRVLQFSLVGTFIGYIIFALSIHYKVFWLLFIARAVPGFTGGNISIVTAALADISKPEDRAKNFGLVGMAFGMGFILGPFLGGVLASSDICSYFNYATPLWFTALLTAINFIYVRKQFPETFQPRQEREVSLFTGIKNLRKAFGLVNMRVILFTVFLQSFAFSFFMQFNQVFLIDKFDFDQKQIGYLFGYIGLWIAFTQGFIIRKITKDYPPPRVLNFSLLGLGFAIFSVLLPPASWMQYLVTPFIAIFQGLTQPNQTSIVSILTPAENQGEVLGIQQSISSLAFIFPPLIAGVLVSFDYRLPLTVSAVITVLAWANFYFRFDAAKLGFALRKGDSQEPNSRQILS